MKVDSTNASGRIRATGPRAMRDALYLIERVTPFFIGYEDPDFQSSDLRALFEGGPRVPKSTSFAFDFPIGEVNSRAEFIRELNSVTGEIGGSCEAFTVEEGGSPSRVRVAAPRNASSRISDVAISLKCERVTYFELFTEICNTVNELIEVEFGLDMPMSRRMLTDRVSVSFDRAPLWRVLDVVSETYIKGRDMIGWNILKDPIGMAVIRVYRVVRSSAARNSTFTMIEGARPLYEAIGILQSDLKCRVSYEDPEYNCPCQILHCRKGVGQDLRGGIMIANYSNDLTSVEIVERLIDSYHRNVRTARFSVVSRGGVIDVVPCGTKDKDGMPVQYESALSVIVSTDVPKGSTLREACRLLLDAANLPPQVPCFLGDLPDIAIPVKESFSREPLRNCIDRLLASYTSVARWGFLFEPRLGGFELSVESLEGDNT